MRKNCLNFSGASEFYKRRSYFFSVFCDYAVKVIDDVETDKIGIMVCFKKEKKTSITFLRDL